MRSPRALPLSAALALLVVLAVVVTGLPFGLHVAGRTAAAAERPRYDVTITRTEYGIPHIVGATYGDVAYGFGYAFAQDNLCVMADDYVTVAGHRARYFGPHGSYDQGGNGVTVNNLDSDFFWTGVRQSHVVDRLLRVPPPLGPKPTVKRAVRGYVAGYNRYLRDIGGAKGVKDPACHGKAWVRPITAKLAYLRFYQLVLLASQDVVIPGIANAKPTGDASSVGGLTNTHLARLLAVKWRRAMGALGSNAVAVGRRGTHDHEHGLLLGNPHFPWIGTERFYQAHLTVPGKVDVSGAMLFGVPIVLIGHNARVAWSHTVSTAYRFTPYQLTVLPNAPHKYVVDGKVHDMKARQVSVMSKQGGKLVKQTRTLWRTRYGPVFTSILGIPLPWTPATAFTMRDANADNFRIFNHFLDTARARSAHDELRILKKYEGIPWVNTIVADKGGHALYADIGSIPNVPDSLVQKCATALGQATVKLLGLPVLDGSRKACDWKTDKDAVEPGIFGPSHLPHLFRSDYVTNSNDSYWLSNPHHPLEGYARIVGDERAERSLRTRIGLIMTQHRVDHGGFTRQGMQNMVFNDRSYAAQLARKQLAKMCKGMGGTAPTSSGGSVPIGNACTVLAKWGGKESLGAHGALLFRRWFSHAYSSPVPVGGPPVPIWSTAFSANNPVRTPNTLNTANPNVRTALGDAIADLRGAHMKLGTTLRRQQYTMRGDLRIPIHGGTGDPHGDFDAISSPWIAGKGLGPVVHGSSFVQVVTWHDGTRCPDVRTILTYSLSTDPTDPHYADQTKLFSKKKWVKGRFCASAIAAAPVHQVLHLRGR